MIRAITPVTDAVLVCAVGGFSQRPDIRGHLEWLRRHLPGAAEIFVACGALRNIVIEVFHGSGANP
jgi:hypothetical protein